MGRLRKLSSLMLSILPMLPIVCVVAFGLFSALVGLQSSLMLWLGLAAAISGVALLLVLLGWSWHALHNRLLTEGGKGVWILALLKLSPIAVPLYWYRYVWQDTADVVLSSSHGEAVVEAVERVNVAVS